MCATASNSRRPCAIRQGVKVIDFSGDTTPAASTSTRPFPPPRQTTKSHLNPTLHSAPAGPSPLGDHEPHPELLRCFRGSLQSAPQLLAPTPGTLCRIGDTYGDQYSTHASTNVMWKTSPQTAESILRRLAATHNPIAWSALN